MDPQTPQTSAQPGVNPLLAHINDTEESHASTRVDFMHPGTIVHPQVNAPVESDSTHNITPDAPVAESKLARTMLAPTESAASVLEDIPEEPATSAVGVASPLVLDAAAPAEPAALDVSADRVEAPEPVIAAAAKKDAEPPAETPPPVPPLPASAPPAPKSPRNRRPLWIILIMLLVLLLASGGAYYWFKVRKPSSPASQPVNNQTITVSPEAPANLEQKNAAGQTLATGGSSKNPIEFGFSLTTSANSGTLQPQVEVQPLGTEFTGQSNYQGADTGVTNGSVDGVVTAKDLKDGSYHWQARFISGDTAGNWVSYGSNEESVADFVIDSTAPTSAKLSSVGGKTVSGSATTISTTNNQPTLSGTAEAGSTVAVSISPDSLSGTATAAEDGSWSLSLNQQLSNGEHTVTITTTDTAGNSQTATLTLNVNAGTKATTTVAPTGDSTSRMTLVGIIGLVVAIAGLVLATRRGQPQV